MMTVFLDLELFSENFKNKVEFPVGKDRNDSRLFTSKIWFKSLKRKQEIKG
jgi:hypothetical protein